MRRMEELDIQPILDLCHFGVPDWIGNFQNTDFAEYFEPRDPAARVRFHTARGKPALRRLRPMGSPIRPMPSSAMEGVVTRAEKRGGAAVTIAHHYRRWRTIRQTGAERFEPGDNPA